MVMIGKVLRLLHREKTSVREIARATGLARNTVRKYLRLGKAEQPQYRRPAVPTKLAPYVEQLEQALIADLPMLCTSQIPTNLTVGTSSDCSEIYLGDFTKMALMLRESLSVQLLSETFAGTGQLAFMCHCRADFAVLYPAAFAEITGIKA